jgi:hypothetical protein
MDRPKPHRWFRFSLRTMFVLVTVFCCWMAYHLNWIRQRRETREWLDLLEQKHGLTGTACGLQDERPNLPLSLRILGEEEDRLIFICLPEYMDEFESEKWFNKVQRLFPESYLLRPSASEEP